MCGIGSDKPALSGGVGKTAVLLVVAFTGGLGKQGNQAGQQCACGSGNVVWASPSVRGWRSSVSANVRQKLGLIVRWG